MASNPYTRTTVEGHTIGGNYPSGTIRIFAAGDYTVGVKNLSTKSEDIYITYTWIQVPTLQDL